MKNSIETQIFDTSFEAPNTCLCILAAIVQAAPEPQRLDRYRNELAANLSGVSAINARTTGLSILRCLNICAPDADEGMAFMTPQRAINVVKTFQQWLLSEEDITETLSSEMTAFFAHVAPLIQYVTGSHWGLIFDVIEDNLEVNFNSFNKVI